MFNEYINSEGRVIHATAIAYDAIYHAQGFFPYVPAIKTSAALKVNNVERSGLDDNGGSEGTPAKPKRAKPAKAEVLDEKAGQ